MKYDIDDLRFVFFTSEGTLPLVKLALSQFFKHNSIDDIKISVVSNSYKLRYRNRTGLDTTEDISLLSEMPFADKVTYIDSGVRYQANGGHFGPSLKVALEQMAEDYIFFFCDDYMFVGDTKWEQIKSIMELMRSRDVDYFGFDVLESGWIPKFTPFEHSVDGLTEPLFQRSNDYRYLFSIQPCIWKRESLLQIVTDNTELTFHGLDETLPKIQRSVNYLALAHTAPSCFTDWSATETLPEYFGIAYIESTRHGAFMLPENGSQLDCKIRNNTIESLISEYDVKNLPGFGHLLWDR